MRELVFMSAQPAILNYAWQLKVQLTNFREMGYSKLAQVLLFIPYPHIHLPLHPLFKELERDFPETKFFYYPDEENIDGTFARNFQYAPILRPHTLSRHFKKYPELKDKAIFYHDADVTFTKYLDFSPFLEDSINYLSNTVSYIGADYLISKSSQVKPELLAYYNEEDPVSKLLSMFGVTKEHAILNNNNSGGAQSLLKDIDYKFWNKVFDGCTYIKMYLDRINQKYMIGDSPRQKNDNGFQAWCADMWSLLWNLWAEGKETRCPKELDFSWATDPISKWDQVHIYHNAGASIDRHDLFFKGKYEYVNNLSTPFEDDLSNVSPNFCSYNYTQQILQANN